MDESNHSPLHLLYVGTNPELISELEARTNDFIVKKFDNGLLANSYINEKPVVDAVLCETEATGMNVLDYASLIKGKNGLQKTPLILVAFEKDDSLFKQAFENKKIIDDFYYYPFKLDNLYLRIKSIKKYYTEFASIKISKNKGYEYKIPFMKRLFDVLVSSMALLFLSPILLLVIIAIRIESKGALIYKSRRVGTGYRIFNFLKFRSMYTGADAKLKELKHLNQYANSTEEDKEEENNKLNTECPECSKLPEGEYCSPLLYVKGQEICENQYFKQKKELGESTFIKISNDPRVTKVGNFIRNTSIDELPQLINVLKGDMSIVGNRPLPLYEAELLTSDDWSLRFLGPAGITGLWQVELRGKKGDMSEEERKTLDNQYAKNYSFWGDIRLILRTIPALLQKDNV